MDRQTILPASYKMKTIDFSRFGVAAKNGRKLLHFKNDFFFAKYTFLLFPLFCFPTVHRNGEGKLQMKEAGGRNGRKGEREEREEKEKETDGVQEGERGAGKRRDEREKVREGGGTRGRRGSSGRR